MIGRIIARHRLFSAKFSTWTKEKWYLDAFGATQIDAIFLQQTEKSIHSMHCASVWAPLHPDIFIWPHHIHIRIRKENNCVSSSDSSICFVLAIIKDKWRLRTEQNSRHRCKVKDGSHRKRFGAKIPEVEMIILIFKTKLLNDRTRIIKDFENMICVKTKLPLPDSIQSNPAEADPILDLICVRYTLWLALYSY